tara:strand:+ start:146 stop:550 length:405 start_codon:yes stop_codon:yes gene_type:complete
MLEVSNDLTQLIMPLISVLVSGIIALSIKDYITKFAKGLAFQMNKSFSEGDKVILDKEVALIVKIGMTQTVFGITKPNGDYTWRYVPNERIPSLRLEKVIFHTIGENNKSSIEKNSKKIDENLQKLSDLHNKNK